MLFDPNSDTGRKLAARLRDEQVIWLTTVRADGTPLPTPVWFLWEDGSFLIYTPGTSLKLRNIANNPRASLNFNSDEYGDNVVVFTGTIEIDRNAPPGNQNRDYLDKYRDGLKSITMTPESFAAEYSVPLRFRPERVRA